MSLTIAIHPDNYTNPSTADRCDASSPRWADLLNSAGHQVKWVDVRRADIFEQLNGCHAFMWRWAHFDNMGRIARRLLPVIEKELGLVVYPDQNTCWHYDDKIAQAYLLQVVGMPIPTTWIWFDRKEAREWARCASYPLVLKLATGAGSRNVRLINNAAEANVWIDRLFNHCLATLDEKQFEPLNGQQRIKATVRNLLRGMPFNCSDHGYELQSGYAFFQEFLPENSFDTRVTVIGERAFAFRRFNRKDDFRASGSGKIDWDVNAIDQSFIRLAFKTAQLLQSQSCAIDGLYRANQSVVGEVSYTYASWAVHQCPGHWKLEGEPETGTLHWVEGQMWPEEAQIEDFLSRLSNSVLLE